MRTATLVALGLVIAWAVLAAAPCPAQMRDGLKLVSGAPEFGLGPDRQSSAYTVTETECSIPANVLWPGDKARVTLKFTNKSGKPLKAAGRVEVIRYGTRTTTDFWVPEVFKIADCGAVPVEVDMPAGGAATVTVEPPIPETFGGYLLVADLGEHGRAFAAGIARTVPADPGRAQFPSGSMDLPRSDEANGQSIAAFQRLGIKAARMEIGYFPTTSKDYEKRMENWRTMLKEMEANSITVMLTVGAGPAPQPLGRPRPHLDDKDVFLQTKTDMAWLPECDEDFQKWCSVMASTFGWPKGPVNAVELWNEPWEGISISGWGADMLRFRELYTRMAQGVEDARRAAGVAVLIGGACSSANTFDKLFCTGTWEFLKWLDFVSIHYQPMSAVPSLVPEFLRRRSPFGPVRVWDTESWVANSEDRVAGVVASMRAQGQDRTNGIYRENVVMVASKGADRKTVTAVHAWAPAAAIAATQKYLGQRRFRELLFKSGLPWVFVFDGRPTGDAGDAPPAPDDGTVVVVGDLGGIYDRDKVLFRSVLGLANLAKSAEARRRLAALPADATPKDRRAAEGEVKLAEVLAGGSMTMPDGGGRFRLFDFYGNALPSKGGKITVPLDGVGYFLRTDGSKGSFEEMLSAIRQARIEGYEPIDVIARDMLGPVAASPTLRLTLTNILNRPVTGKLTVKLGDLKLEPAEQAVQFAPHETKEIAVRVTGSAAAASNTYPLSLVFDAGADGKSLHEEPMHVNLIARRTIIVDGNLEDWKGVLPQPVGGAGLGASMTEKAWLPFEKFGEGVSAGLATGYLAYDANFFYFAARIADSTPYAGGVRFEARDDDAYFYPVKSIFVQRDPKTKQETKREEATWPEGVRRFSYRKNPDLPSGIGTDNVQIAFNVIPLDKEPWLPNPPGTMPRFMAYRCTDYEYALNHVAEQHGGGTEIWRLLAPGVPMKHFYPRQPKAQTDGGPVKAGRLATRRDGNMRIVEAAVPWAEIPDVKKRLDAGETIKFTFRINDNQGPALELASDRSASKENPLALHNQWMAHWANELEFAFEK